MTCARTLILIQERDTVDDGFGGRSTTWIDFCRAYAETRFVKGRESTTSSDGDRVAALETWLLKIRFKSGITTDMTVFWNDERYNIRSAVDREQKRMHITLEIEKGVAD